jgi:XTP/dITP diphosphohydrolase
MKMNLPINKIPIAADSNDLRELFQSFNDLVWILRKECPWDREQTNESIAQLTIEEAYEAVDAIYKKDDDDFAGELGDLLLHIVMHSVIAEQRGAFDMKEVIRKIHSKMVRRHPHVFGETEVNNQFEVLENWEMIKKQEKNGEGTTLDGVPPTLPALLRAERIQHKASRVGFDWDKKEDMWEKVEEEFTELKEEIKAGNHARIKEEFGDFLFSLVNAARYEDIVPEEALQLTNMKFTNRFGYIEEKAKELGKSLKEMTLAEMDVFWEEAKLLE